VPSSSPHWRSTGGGLRGDQVTSSGAGTGGAGHANGAVLSLTGVTKSYPGVQALTGIDLRLAPASVHALLGENGAGKSTLIRILSGAERPDHGTLRLGGSPYSPGSPLDALRAGVSTLYQERNLFPDRSVAQNILAGDEPTRAGLLLDLRAMRAVAADLLGRLGATHIDSRARAGNLSVADRQLVDIARALHRRSKVLIMDEPTAALTSREVDALFGVVSGLPALGVSVLFVSHRMEEIFRIADAVTVLRDGRRVLSEAASALSGDDLVRAVVGSDPDSTFPARRPVGAALGKPVLDAVSLTGPGFEDIALTIHSGEVLGLAGVTGSGKEQLGMALFGAAPVRSGRILVNGRPVRLTPRRAARAGVAGVPADRREEGVIGPLSVRRNLSLPSLGAISSFGFIRSAREDRLARSRVEELAVRTAGTSTPVEQLSGGNQQKISLGKWLERRPAVLVLLEPTQGIDVGVRFQFYRLVRRLASAGTGVLLVSSDVPEVLGLSDRIVVLRNGRQVGHLPGPGSTAEQLIRLSLGRLPEAFDTAVVDATITAPTTEVPR